MLGRSYTVLCIIIVGSITPVSSASDKVQKSVRTTILDDEIMAVIARFPLDTETITFAKGPFDVKHVSAESVEEPQDPSLLHELQRMPIGILLNLRKGAYGELLAGAKVAMGVEGARRFRPPRRLGDARFEGCQILVLADTDDGVAKLDQVMKRLPADATQRRWVMGYEVFLLSEKFEDEWWDIRVVRPSPREILLATEEAYLNDVLARLKVLKQGGKRPSDALAGFPGWKHVDTGAPFWAVRRYDVGAARDDPTSPVGLHKSAPLHDLSAIGLTLSYVPGHPGQIRLHYLTSATDAESKAVRLLRSWDLVPQGSTPMLHQVEPGVTRLEADLADRPVGTWVFGILGLIGHAILL